MKNNDKKQLINDIRDLRDCLKQFLKNESFIPETPLNELAISTGRPKLLDLYINGKKVEDPYSTGSGFTEDFELTIPKDEYYVLSNGVIIISPNFLVILFIKH